MMIYNDLALFVAVARHLNFSAAAQQIDVPLSRVSRRIADLEDFLGAKLFERTTRQVRLTEEGRRLLDQCQQPIDALGEVAGFSDDTSRAKIRITAPPLAARTSLGPRLLSFAKSNPDTKLELTTTNEIMDFYRDNVDLAFRLGPLEDSSLIARRLWSVPYCFCASGAMVAKFGLDGSVSLNRFRALPALVSRQPWLLQSGEQVKPTTIEHEIDDLELLADAARQDMGVTMLPLDMATDGLQVLSVTDASPLTRAMYAVYPGRRLLPARVRNLIDFMATTDVPARNRGKDATGS